MYNVTCGRFWLPDHYRNIKPNSLVKLFYFFKYLKRCTSDDLCKSCERRRRLMVIGYHLHRNARTITAPALKYYFKNVSDHYLTQIMIEGSGSVELDMRRYYRTLYNIKLDQCHQTFESNLKKFDHAEDRTFANRNYWKTVLFVVLYKSFRYYAIIFEQIYELNLTVGIRNFCVRDIEKLSKNPTDRNDRTRLIENTKTYVFKTDTVFRKRKFTDLTDYGSNYDDCIFFDFMQTYLYNLSSEKIRVALDKYDLYQTVDYRFYDRRCSIILYIF